MTEPTFQQLFALPGAFPNPTFSLEEVCARSDAVADDAEYWSLIFGSGTSFPTFVAFLDDATPNSVLVGHSPAIYPGDVTDPNPDLDNKVVVFFGHSASSCVPFVLQDEAFANVNTRFVTSAPDHFARVQADGLTDNIVDDATVSRENIRRCFILNPQRASIWIDNPLMSYANFLAHVLKWKFSPPG